MIENNSAIQPIKDVFGRKLPHKQESLYMQKPAPRGPKFNHPSTNPDRCSGFDTVSWFGLGAILVDNGGGGIDLICSIDSAMGESD